MRREVLHVNVANFSAAVEELCNPLLRGKPFVIAPPYAKRAVVLDLSEKAFKEGLRKGMPLVNVQKKRGIHIIEPHYNLYTRAEKYLRKLVSHMAPVIEGISGGHLFLDITGTKRLFGNSVDHAVRIKREIDERLGLPPIVGLANNRLVSKVATRVVKPDGFISVAPGEERSFLQYQDIRLLPGIGKKLFQHMHMLGVQEVGELASLSDYAISTVIGKKGIRLRDSARGIDFTPVVSEPVQLRRIRAETVFDSDTNDLEEIEASLFLLAEEAGLKVRQNNMLAMAVELSLLYSDGLENRGSSILPQLSFCDRDFYDTAQKLLRKTALRRVRIRRLSLALFKLHEGDTQLDLFVPEARIKRENLQKSIDLIRKKFGRESIKAGCTLHGRVYE